jgi:hypothetical protein
MIPDDPHLEGNPVFSVHQADIIYYGHDLEDYLRHEFGLSGRKPANFASGFAKDAPPSVG